METRLCEFILKEKIVKGCNGHTFYSHLFSIFKLILFTLTFLLSFNFFQSSSKWKKKPGMDIKIKNEMLSRQSYLAKADEQKSEKNLHFTLINV